jgi:hypothetical protein
VSPQTQAELSALLTDNLWKLLPAVVIALVSFGFKRLTSRVLGVFEQVKELDETMKVEAARAQEQRVAHSSRLDRIEKSLDHQARRIDALHRGAHMEDDHDG